MERKRLTELEPVFVVTIPIHLEAGKLYVSEKYHTTAHLCPCGCGERVVMPTNDKYGWKLINNDGRITMRPSVGNFEFACKSHYYITDNKIEWL